MTDESERDDTSPGTEDVQPDVDAEVQPVELVTKQFRWLQVGVGLLAAILILALAGPGLRDRLLASIGPGLRDRLSASADPTAKSIAELAQTAAAQPTDEASQYKLASAYYQAHRFDEAWAQFRKVPAYRQAAEAHPEIADAERAVQAAPESKEAHFKLGTAWARAQLLAPAETAFQQAIALDSRYVDALSNLGAVYYQMNRLSDALGEYNAALAVNPDDAAVHYDKGVVYVQQALQASPPDETLLNQGTGEIRRALEINPNLPQAHFSLGVVYMKRGQSQEAIAEFQRFLALDDGSDPEATANAQAYLKQLQQ